LCSPTEAPAVIDGAVNGEIFLAYVKQVLAPTLTPDKIVVMDNLSSHKIEGVPRKTHPIRLRSYLRSKEKK
jgi:transposase